MTTGVVRKVFSSSIAWSASSVHANLSDFFSNLKKARPLFLPKLIDEAN
jgi:hypothetical protein